MLLPQIPTDNLYKFLFVAGLTFIGASILLFINKHTDIENELDAIKLDVIKFENTYFKDSLEFASIGDNIDASIKKDSNEVLRLEKIISDKKSIKDFEVDKTHQMLAETRNKISAAEKASRERLADHRLRGEMIRFKFDIQQREMTKLIVIAIICAVGVIAGFWLTYFGYHKWKINIQKPTDERVKFELEKLKST